MTKEELKQYQHEYWKQYKKKYGDRIRAKQREFYNTSYHNNPEFKSKRIKIYKNWIAGEAGKIWKKKTNEKMRYRSRKYYLLKEAIKKGKIKRLPCEICGIEKTHAHHPDYKYPLKVNWLCSKHHKELHRIS